MTTHHVADAAKRAAPDDWESLVVRAHLRAEKAEGALKVVTAERDEERKRCGDYAQALGLLSTLKGDFETPRLLDDPVGSAREIHDHVSKQIAQARAAVNQRAIEELEAIVRWIGDREDTLRGGAEKDRADPGTACYWLRLVSSGAREHVRGRIKMLSAQPDHLRDATKTTRLENLRAMLVEVSKPRTGDDVDDRTFALMMFTVRELPLLLDVVDAAINVSLAPRLSEQESAALRSLDAAIAKLDEPVDGSRPCAR